MNIKMQKQKLSFVLWSGILLASIQIAAGQIIHIGQCPSGIKVVENFNASQYLGTWYEYSKYPFVFELGGRCIQAEYGALSSDKISVVNKQIGLADIVQSIDGTADLVAPGKLSVLFSGFAGLAGAADYWVLDTDYVNYAVVYSCKNLLLTHSQVVWILTRDRQPSEDIVTKAKEAISKQKLSLKPLTITDQSNCEKLE